MRPPYLVMLKSFLSSCGGVRINATWKLLGNTKDIMKYIHSAHKSYQNSKNDDKITKKNTHTQENV